VYGHLVASDVFQDGYVVPLDASLQDMKKKLAAESVCLPTKNDLYLWHISQWHGEDTNHHLAPRLRSLSPVHSYLSSQSSTPNSRDYLLVDDSPPTLDRLSQGVYNKGNIDIIELYEKIVEKIVS